MTAFSAIHARETTVVIHYNAFLYKYVTAYAMVYRI